MVEKLKKVDDSNYKYSSELFYKFQQLKPLNKILSADLIENAFNCDIQSFNENVLAGANIFYSNKNGYNAFMSSIEENCLDITKELVALGFKFDFSDKINIAMANLLLKMTKPFQTPDIIQEEQNSKFELINLLIKNNYELLNRQFLPTDYFSLSIFALGDLSNFSKDCLDQSTLMHLLAYKNDTFLFNKLKELGYSTTIKNHCGLSPEMILK